MGGAALDGPIFHGGGHRVGDGWIERRALLDSFLQCLEDRLGQPFALHGLAEYVFSKQILHVHFREVDLLELILGGGDGLQSNVTQIHVTHSMGYSNYKGVERMIPLGQ